MNSRFILAAFTTIALVAGQRETVATEKLSLRVTPNVSKAPSNVTVKATIARHPDNRWLHIEADSGTFLRSSSIQLDGAKAPLVSEFHFRNLPGGNYEVVAVLRNHLGEQTVVRKSVVVLSRFAEP